MILQPLSFSLFLMLQYIRTKPKPIIPGQPIQHRSGCPASTTSVRRGRGAAARGAAGRVGGAPHGVVAHRAEGNERNEGSEGIDRCRWDSGMDQGPMMHSGQISDDFRSIQVEVWMSWCNMKRP